MLARPQSGSLRLRKLQPRPKHFPAIQFRTSGANGVAAAPYLLTRQRTQGQKRKVSAENCGKTKMRRGATWVYNKCAASDHSEPLNKKKVRQPAHNGGAVKKNAPALFRLIQQSGLAACRQAAPQVADGPELAWPAQLERAPYSSEPIRAKGKAPSKKAKGLPPQKRLEEKKSPAASGFANSITAKIHFPPYRSEPSGANGKGRSLPTYAPMGGKTGIFRLKTANCRKPERRRGAPWACKNSSASDHSKPLNKKKPGSLPKMEGP